MHAFVIPGDRPCAKDDICVPACLHALHCRVNACPTTLQTHAFTVCIPALDSSPNVLCAEKEEIMNPHQPNWTGKPKDYALTKCALPHGLASLPCLAYNVK